MSLLQWQSNVYRSIVCQCRVSIAINTSTLKRLFSHLKRSKYLLSEKGEFTALNAIERFSPMKNAQAVTCQHCYNRNDLSDHKVKTLLGVNLETYGTLHLKKRGIIEISSIHVGNAVIQGKIKGDVDAMGTVEIQKKGEIYGSIICRKLVVNKGGIFSGKVKMLNAETN